MARINLKESTGIIYKITNKINNKIYIGLTHRQLIDRWRQHIKASRYKYYSDYNNKLHRAIRKYGEENFQIELLEETNTNLLNEREKYWIKFYNSKETGYNISNGGEGYSLYIYEDIYKKWEKGKSCKEIIKETGISYTTLAEILNKYGITSEERIQRSIDKKVNIDKEIIKQQFLLGKSINKIHLELNLSISWIKKILKEFGFTEEQIKENAILSHKTSGSPKRIEQYDKDKNFIQSFASIKEAKIFLNKKINNTSLNKVLKHDNNFHYYDNYYWRYIE